MGIQEFVTKFKEDKEFAAEFKKCTSFGELLKEVNAKGYFITKEDVLEFLGKEQGGDINEADLARVVGGDGPYNHTQTASCSDYCSPQCSTKCG